MSSQRLTRILCSLAAFAISADELKVGDSAPEFVLPGSDGKTHDLSQLKGRWVVLAWFPKAFTGGWTAECKSLRESGEQIRKYDVAYFMVSVDKPEDNKKFAQQEHADFPILSDPAKTVANAYGVIPPGRQFASRWTFYIGPEGKIAFIDKQVNPATAGSSLAAKLKELGVPERLWKIRRLVHAPAGWNQSTADLQVIKLQVRGLLTADPVLRRILSWMFRAENQFRL